MAKSAWAKAHPKRGSKSAKGKLRDVVETIYIATIDPKTGEHDKWNPIALNYLECGHYIRVRKDFGGEVNSERRRCPKCSDGLLPDALEVVRAYYQELRYGK